MAKKQRAGKSPKKKQDSFDGPLPDRRAMEKILREITGHLDDGPPRGETALDRAQDLIYQAFDASGPEQVRLARQAIKTSPDCADAYVLLAELAETAEEALELYEKGVAAGQRALGPKAFKELEGEFWGFLETRPYMRARGGLAQCLWEIGRHEEAAEHFREMLRLNPNDNQGIRYSLAMLLLDMDRDEEVRGLLKQYEDDAMAQWAYTRALLAFRAGGDTTEARRLLKNAKKSNKHVPDYLLGHKQFPEDLPPYISMGGEDEAGSYAMGNRHIWMNTPGAVTWLRKTLNVPLPKVSKPRRPSWPELRLALRRCTLECDEVWQIDAMPSGFDPGEGEEAFPWVVIMVNPITYEPLGMEIIEGEPKPNDVWDILTDAMLRPRGGPHRPGIIQV